MKFVRKYISLFLLIIVLIPSVIQVSHVLAEEHHEAEVCLSKDEHHYHEQEIECELCTFNINEFSYDTYTEVREVSIHEIIKVNHYYYYFKSKFHSSVSLRGPPSLT